MQQEYPPLNKKASTSKRAGLFLAAIGLSQAMPWHFSNCSGGCTNAVTQSAKAR